jgi:hypothetical protein
MTGDQLWPHDRVRTAWHEAGHVVVSQVLGVRVLGASIVPDAQSGWHWVTGHESEPDRLHRWEAWRDGSAMKNSPHLANVLIAMAGYAAQRRRPRLKGQHSPRHREGYHTSGDMLRVWRSLGELTTANHNHAWRLHRRLVRATDALVRRHRDAISRVAAALLVLDTLDEQQIEALVPLRRCPPNWARPTVLMESAQVRELATPLRAPRRRLMATVPTRPNG